MSSKESDFEAVRRWIAMLPSEEESARSEVERFLDMTPDERLECWAQLQRSMNSLARMNPPMDDPTDRDFWRHWRDPSHGRPR